MVGELKIQSSNHFSETTLICMVLVCNFHLAETECEHIAGQNRTEGEMKKKIRIMRFRFLQWPVL